MIFLHSVILLSFFPTFLFKYQIKEGIATFFLLSRKAPFFYFLNFHNYHLIPLTIIFLNLEVVHIILDLISFYHIFVESRSYFVFIFIF